MASQYDTETKAQALTLLELGKPASHVAGELKLPERTVQHWAQRWRRIAAEEGDRILTDDDYRLALRVGELIHDALDQMVDRDDLYKYLVPLNIIRGTAIDKILKRREAKHQPPAIPSQNVLIIVNAQPPPGYGETVEGSVPPVIEGEAEEG